MIEHHAFAGIVLLREAAVAVDGRDDHVAIGLAKLRVPLAVLKGPDAIVDCSNGLERELFARKDVVLGADIGRRQLRARSSATAFDIICQHQKRRILITATRVDLQDPVQPLASARDVVRIDQRLAKDEIDILCLEARHAFVADQKQWRCVSQRREEDAILVVQRDVRAENQVRLNLEGLDRVGDALQYIAEVWQVVGVEKRHFDDLIAVPINVSIREAAISRVVEEQALTNGWLAKDRKTGAFFGFLKVLPDEFDIGEFLRRVGEADTFNVAQCGAEAASNDIPGIAFDIAKAEFEQSG